MFSYFLVFVVHRLDGNNRSRTMFFAMFWCDFSPDAKIAGRDAAGVLCGMSQGMTKRV